MALWLIRWAGTWKLHREWDWVNLDLVWALALIATGVATPLL